MPMLIRSEAFAWLRKSKRLDFLRHSYFYGSIENMMEACLKCQYLRPAAAKRLTRKYHKSAGKACVKHTR